MRKSESIASLAVALVAAQKEIKAVGKDATNPHFKNRYASLDALTEFARPILQKNGLAVLQGGVDSVDGIEIETILLHTSGEWIASSYKMPLEKATAQGAGSAITYGRRYGLSSLLALTTDEDDDGVKASEPKAAAAVARPAPREGVAGGSTPGPTSAPQKLPPLGAKFDVTCPKCGGDMWDNRIGKKNPKAPDAKCKNAPKCDGVIWPEKPKDDKKPVAVASGMGVNNEGPDDYPAALRGNDDDLPF